MISLTNVRVHLLLAVYHMHTYFQYIHENMDYR